MSEVIFICTSNGIANILAPLIDRIEVINVPAYLPIEKMNIAKHYIMPALEKEYGFIEEEKTVFSTETTEAAKTTKKTTSEPVTPSEFKE